MPQTRQTGKSGSASLSPSSSRASNQDSSPERQRHPAKVTRSTSNQSSQSDPLATQRESLTEIRATWTGKGFLIISGLKPEHFPPDNREAVSGHQKSANANGILKAFDDQSPSKASRNGRQRNRGGAATPRQRAGLKRKASGISNADIGSEIDGSDNGQVDDLDEGAANGGLSSGLQPTKRRRRGRQSQAQSQVPSRAPSPQLPMIDPENDILGDVDLPPTFLPEYGDMDPEEPDDEAQKLYKQLYEPLPGFGPFVTALTKFDPRQRSTENLYKLADNTARALRAWQDEYLKIDRLTARYAPIVRKPATGNRQTMDPTTFEDHKEADLYDYNYDPKKPGFQDAVAQRIVRFGSGRELRHRGQRNRVGADGQLLNAAAAAATSDDDGNRRQRHRKPVTKYDGIVPADQQRRKRTIASDGSEQLAKRGRWAGRGSRGGRGIGRGGRGGGLLGKRIQEMREASVGTSVTSGSNEEGESDSEDENPTPYDSREGSLALPQDQHPDFDANSTIEPDLSAAAKRKGRPKGSKNLHVRSDKGIPKGPRNKSNDPGQTSTPNDENKNPAELPTQPQSNGAVAQPQAPHPSGSIDTPQEPTSAQTQPPNQNQGAKTNPKTAQPKSEKRSQSMTDWWARRKAAAAQAKLLEAQTQTQARPQPQPQPQAQHQALAQSIPQSNVQPGARPNLSSTAPSPAAQSAYAPPPYAHSNTPMPPYQHVQYPHTLPPGMMPMHPTHLAPPYGAQTSQPPPMHYYPPHSHAPPHMPPSYAPQGIPHNLPPPGWQHMPIPMPMGMSAQVAGQTQPVTSATAQRSTAPSLGPPFMGYPGEARYATAQPQPHLRPEEQQGVLGWGHGRSVSRSGDGKEKEADRWRASEQWMKR